MSNDDHRLPECDDCDDDSGRCNNPVLDEERYFSLTLRWGFKNRTCIPCYARPHVCDKIHVHAFEENVTKEVKLKTKHGFIFKVEIFNEPEVTFFGCSNWYALSKTYAFEEDMEITFDLGLRRRGTGIFHDEDIWVPVGDMKPVLSSSYIYAPIDVRKMFDNTFFNRGLELTLDEQDDFIKVLKNLPMVADFYNAGASYTPYVPFVLELLEEQIHEISLRLPKDVVPRWMPDRGGLTIVCAHPWGESFKHDYSTKSGRNGCVRIKGWRKIVVRKNPKAGD